MDAKRSLANAKAARKTKGIGGDIGKDALGLAAGLGLGALGGVTAPIVGGALAAGAIAKGAYDIAKNRDKSGPKLPSGSAYRVTSNIPPHKMQNMHRVTSNIPSRKMPSSGR